LTYDIEFAIFTSGKKHGGRELISSERHVRGLTIIDAIITLCLIGILLGIVIPKYRQVARSAQEVALKTGLSNIRTSITLFNMLNKRNPKTLRELVETDVMLPSRIGKDPYTGSIFKQKYLTQQSMDASGNIIDSFGNPFAYDALQGDVKTTTKGYEAW